jgi:hypothetical protein
VQFNMKSLATVPCSLLLVAVVANFSFAADIPLQPVSATSTPEPKKLSPNQALAAFAKEIIISSMPPQYEKREHWGDQKEITSGYVWKHRDGGWHLDRETKKVNDGLWRAVEVRMENPEQNLQVRLTKPRAAEEGRTAFSVFLTAKLQLDARQEQWRIGIKGLNFHAQGEVVMEVRLDLEIGMAPVPGASFGTIEIQPHVNAVGLRLVDLRLTRLDAIHGDLARELGNAVEDIIGGEIHKQEPKVRDKINAEIEKNKSKLQFSPAQIAEIGWEKIQTLLGATNAAEPAEKKKKQSK